MPDPYARQTVDRRSARPRLAKGEAAARRKAQKECPSCWTVGGHDPRCQWRKGKTGGQTKDGA